MRRAGLLLCTLAACGGSRPPLAHGVAVNRFVSDEAIGAVKICQTNVDELVGAFGQPNQRGRDGSMLTLQWSAAVLVTTQTQGAMQMQNILAWVDEQGLVANLIVNPTSMPLAPSACDGIAAGKPANRSEL